MSDNKIDSEMGFGGSLGIFLWWLVKPEFLSVPIILATIALVELIGSSVGALKR